MTKSEATQAMREGKRVRHRHFEPHEWVTIIDDRIWSEDGYSYSYDEFWCVRTGSRWTKDWEIYGEQQTDLSGIQFDGERLESENAALKAALAELIKHSVSLCEMLSETDLQEYRQEVKAAIDSAKKLLNKQSQSESDGDKNLS